MGTGEVSRVSARWGVTVALARFTPAVEAPRRELYMKEREALAHIAAVSTAGEIARIASPANGMVIALDPDIPSSFQRVPLTANGVSDGMVFKLNGALIGKAGGRTLWSPKPGTYLLALEDSSGHTLDRAHFIVR